MSEAQTADPIPEAPADEEVEGVAVDCVRELRKHLRDSPVANIWLDTIVAALRRSTATDKPGVRDAALEEAAKVADMFAADHAKSAEQFGIDRNRELHNAAKGAAQGVAFAIRALSASPAPEEQATHRHKKRGGEYVLIGFGKMQSEDWHDLSIEPQAGGDGCYCTHHPDDPAHDSRCYVPPGVDMRDVAIYRSATDPTEIWARPREEFEDGRFEPLPRSTAGGAK